MEAIWRKISETPIQRENYLSTAVIVTILLLLWLLLPQKNGTRLLILLVIRVIKHYLLRIYSCCRLLRKLFRS